MYKNENQLLEPQINYDEVSTIYIDEPNVLIVEKEQYEIYDLFIYLFYSQNQLDIWSIIFKSIDLF